MNARSMAESIAALDTAGAPPWSKSHGLYLAGRAVQDGVDALAIEMERKWGAGRLRLLVGPELRERFDRQRLKWNHALWHGDLEELRREATRMETAWRVLDRVAGELGAQPVSGEAWEVTLADGTVAAIVRDLAAVPCIAAEGRKVAVYSLEEIGRLLSSFPTVVTAKVHFPGARVEAVSAPSDPLDSVRDIDESIPFGD